MSKTEVRRRLLGLRKEVWYTWREVVQVPGERRSRLLVPWSDPYEYEQEFDYLFETKEEAMEAKEDQAPDEDWVLVRMTLEQVEI